MIYLYDSTETDFRYNGKPLPIAYDVTVSNTLNSEYYVIGKYPLDKNKVYKEIVEDRIIKVHTMDGMQPFRIVSVNKHELYVEFEAWPLFYADMRNKLVKPLNLKRVSGQVALNSFKNNLLIDTPFDFYSDITDNHDYHTQDENERENNPKQLYNALDVFKTIVNRWGGELWVRGYDIRVNKRIGTDTESMLYEKKNITEFVDTTNIEGIVTRLHGKSEWQDEPQEGEEEGQKHSIEVTVDSPLINDYSGVVFEKQFTNNDIRTEQELKNWLNLKFTTENIDKPQRTIEVGTNVIDETKIGFSDTLILKYIKHDTDVRIKVVGYEYDGFANELKHVVLGQPKHTSSSTIGNTITDLVNNVVDPIDRKTTIAMSNTDGKSTVFHGTANPNTLNLNAKENDTYFRTNGSEKEIWRFTGTLWELVMGTSDTTKNAREIEAVIEQAETDRAELEEEIGSSLLLAKAHAESEDARIRGELESEIGDAIGLAEQAKQDAIDKANQALADAKAHADAELERINTELSTDIGDAIDLAEQAKQEAERLVTEQDTVYQELFDGYNAAVDDLTQGIGVADQKAVEALTKAEESGDLAQAAVEVAGRAEANAESAAGKADNAVAKADDAFIKAEDAINSITTFEPLVSGAVTKADEAITKANNIPATVDGIITDKGLVNGDWVDTRIDDVTGEINYQLESVRGDTPDVIMGIEWDKTESPLLSRTDYVEEFANLEDYNLQTAEFNLSVEGLEMNLSEIERDKLDGSDFTSFKNNEYANTVNGITNRLTSVETNKLDDSVFADFKEHDYAVTVSGINGSIESLESNKLDNTDFVDFKTNEYQLTVDGFNMGLTNLEGAIPTLVLGVEWDLSANPNMERTDYVEEADLTDYYNPDYIMGIEWDKESNPTLIRTNSVQDVVNLEDYREQTAEFEFTIDGFEQSLTSFDKKKLDGEVFTTFKTSEYTNTIDGITQRLSSVETDKLDGNELQTFKTNEYQVTVDGFSGEISDIKRDKLDTDSFDTFKTNEYDITVDGISGDITDLKRDKLDGQEFQDFKSNEYQLTVDGFDMQLTGVSGAIPTIVLGVEWDRSESPQMERTDYTEELDLTNYDAPDYVMGVEWDKKENPLMVRTYDTQESTPKEDFEVFLADYSFRADGWDATNSYITENSTAINSLMSNAQGWSQTISYVDENQTKFNDTVSQVDFYKQTIGSDAEKLAQLVMTDGAFVTRIGELEGMAEDIIVGVEWDKDSDPTMARTGYMDDWTETQVSQLADSWSMNLKSNDDVVTAINATEAGVRILGASITLDGDTLVTGDFAVSGKNVILDADTQIRGNFTVSGSNVILNAQTTVMGDFSVLGKNIILDGDTTVTGDFTVAGDIVGSGIHADNITTGTINTARLNVSDIVTKGLTTNVIKADHIETSTVTIDKLFANASTINRLAAKQAFIDNVKAVDISAARITSGTIKTARLNAKEIVTEGLVANVIKADHIHGDSALFDKLFSSVSATTRLSAQTAWIKDANIVNATISGAKIADATIGSAKIADLDVSKISGNTANFVVANFNAGSNALTLSGNGLRSTGASYSYSLNSTGVSYYSGTTEVAEMRTYLSTTGGYSGRLRGLAINAKPGYETHLGYGLGSAGGTYTPAIAVDGTNGRIYMDNIYPDRSTSHGLQFTSGTIGTNQGWHIRHSNSNSAGIFLANNGHVYIRRDNGTFRNLSTWDF